LAVPYISVEHRDGYALGAVHGSRVDECLKRLLCQSCGEPLSDPLVLFVRPQDTARGYVAEPALHPQCARYAAAACPMLNGGATHYRRTPVDLSRHACSEAGCECGGWVPGPDNAARVGQPAGEWAAWWVSLVDYRLAVGEDSGRLLGVALPETPRRVRPVRTAAGGAEVRS
jgi:hypothetical protein